MRLSLGLASQISLATKASIRGNVGAYSPQTVPLRRRHGVNKPFIPSKRAFHVTAAAGDTTTDAASLPSTAKACVETGLKKFESGDAQGALTLFQHAMTLKPNDDEARAALYNAACALTKLKRWEEAADAVVSAVNDYNLKLAVALRDPDLALLRERREWNQALGRAAGGISTTSFVKLRAEAKAPFRLTRIFLFGGLTAGAGVGLIVITARLIAALRGGEGAPELADTVQNFAINIGALGLLGFLLYRDLTGQSKDEAVVEREEALASLLVSLGPTRTVPLAAFRGTTRPVIITGSKGQINKALAAAEPFKSEMRLRGVSIVPVVFSEEDPGEKLRRLKTELALEGGGGAVTDATDNKPQGFGSASSSASSKSASSSAAEAVVNADGQVSKDDRRWQLEAAGLSEWSKWVKEQTKAAGVVSPGDNYYVQVQLDGSVRASGPGIPPWRQFLDDIPPLDDVRTKLTDGKGIA